MKMKLTKVLAAAALMGFMGVAQADYVRGSGVYNSRSCQGAYIQLKQSLLNRADRNCRGRVVQVRFHQRACYTARGGRHNHHRSSFNVRGGLRYDCVRRPHGGGGYGGGHGGGHGRR